MIGSYQRAVAANQWNGKRTRTLQYTAPGVLFIHIVRQRVTPTGTRKVMGRVPISRTLAFADSQYTIFAIGVHHGLNSDRGHCTAFVCSAGQWYACNDGPSGVHPCSEEAAFDCDAYVVGYQRTGLRAVPSVLQPPELSVGNDNEDPNCSDERPSKRRKRATYHRRRLKKQSATRVPRAKKNAVVLNEAAIAATLHR